LTAWQTGDDMTRRRALLACAYLALLAGIATVIWKISPPADSLDPGLQTLLDEPAQNDPEHKSTFFRELRALAEKQGLNIYRFLKVRVDEAFAVRIREDGATYVVAIVYGYCYANPIADAHYLILFNDQGKLLDRMSVTWGWTRYSDDVGKLITEGVDAPQEDGAQIVSRYLPGMDKKALWIWDYELVHGNNISGAYSDQEKWDANQRENRGLCRIAIRNGKFAVVFPKPQENKRPLPFQLLGPAVLKMPHHVLR
jgi:hypothetical protein